MKPSTENPFQGARNQSSSSVSSASSNSRESISDVVSYSLCALCSIRLNYLYPENYHDSFRSSIIKRMVEYFELPQRVTFSIQEFTLEDEFTFLSSIKQHYQQGPFKLIEELVIISVSSGSHDARTHYLIIEVAELLGIPRDLVEIHCESIYSLLLKAQDNVVDGSGNTESEKDREKRDTSRKIKKYVMIGLASLGGGAVIGVTGGLAAPIVASAFAGVIGAGSIVLSSAAAGIVGSLFGVAGAGLTASKMNKRIGDLEEFSFESLNSGNEQTSLTITIAISGWVSDEGPQEFVKQWKYLRHTKEQYCLCYESKYLLELSTAMDYLLSFVVSYATQEALKYTFLASVMAAIAWPVALISIANIIDNPWDVCLGRSAQAGKHLADVLMSRQQGKRPASLIGFSLGARVIFFCLQELVQRKDSEGIIGDVVLLGAPVTASMDQWKPIGRVVSGRIINGYSSSDWLLKFLYRTSSAAIRVAGLQEIKWKDRRVKNIDLSPLVGGHMDYFKKLNEILDYVGIRTVATYEDDLVISASTDVATTTSPLAENCTSGDSGIERSVSNSTNISSSLSQQSLANQTGALAPGTDVLSVASSSSSNTTKIAPSNIVTVQTLGTRGQFDHQQSTSSVIICNTRPVERTKEQQCEVVSARSRKGSSVTATTATSRRRPSSLARKRAVMTSDLRATGKFISAAKNVYGVYSLRNRSKSV